MTGARGECKELLCRCDNEDALKIDSVCHVISGSTF